MGIATHNAMLLRKTIVISFHDRGTAACTDRQLRHHATKKSGALLREELLTLSERAIKTVGLLLTHVNIHASHQTATTTSPTAPFIRLAAYRPSIVPGGATSGRATG